MKVVLFLICGVFCTDLIAKDPKVLEDECNAGKTGSCFQLANYFKRKDGDKEKMKKLYEKSCKSGFFPACAELKVMRYNAGSSNTKLKDLKGMMGK